MNILIADDEKGIRIGLSRLFSREGHQAFSAEDIDSALATVKGNEIHLALLDIRIGSGDGIELLKEIKKISNETICLMITGYGSIDNAVEAMKQGAADYLLKPLDTDQLLAAVSERLELKQLKNENLLLKEELRERMSDFDFRTSHPGMKKILSVADKVKNTNATVLITGESGTGKEVLSRYIHYGSNRKDHPFVGVNCAALSDTLLLSELFGHEKGAFTGAADKKIGKFELAHKGTLFLDEIGDMSLDAQAKLLRVLEESSLERVGGNKSIQVDIRVIAATNQDLQELIRDKRFREDLYYRLNVISLNLPALRERPGDISLLADYFRERYSREYKKGETRFAPEVLMSMEEYHWPGNVRELRNLINQTVLLSDGGMLEPMGFASTGPLPSKSPNTSSVKDFEPAEGTLQEQMDEITTHYEKRLIQAALERNRYNRSSTAEELGVCRKTLFNKCEKYGI